MSNEPEPVWIRSDPINIREAIQEFRDAYYKASVPEPKIYIPKWRKPKWWEVRRRKSERELKRAIEESKGHIVVWP